MFGLSATVKSVLQFPYFFKCGDNFLQGLLETDNRVNEIYRSVIA